MTSLSHNEDFKALFEQRYKDLAVKEGAVLKGRVVMIHRDLVAVDVGFKSEGLIPIEEFRDFDGSIKIQPGDEVDVVVEQLEDKNGNVVLSKERADAVHSWDRVEKVFEENVPIDGVIVNKIKGGMSVNLGGIKGFLPASQIDLKPVKSLDKMIGQKYQFKILKLNKLKGNIVLSRRVVLEEERASQKKGLLENLREGQVVKGIVKNITDYGAFVDLGGIDGLLHITDLSWGRVTHPSEVLNVGDEIDVVVLKYDAGNEKVSLGFKQLKTDPWKEVSGKFNLGDRIKGKVVNVTDYGVFVEMAEGVEGLVHVSELTWNKKLRHPSKVVKQGDLIEAVVLDLDPANRRISLGVKQLEPSPWIGLKERYAVGTKVKGVIRNITDFGIFVGIEGEEIDGLVHISDMSWEKNVKHPGELFQKGQEIEVVVLSVDKDNERFALGVKQLNEDPWGAARRKFPEGSTATGAVAEIQAKGVVITLEGGVPAYLAVSDFSSHGPKEPEQVFKVGDEVTAQVKKTDDRAHRIVLSVKAHEKAMEKAAVSEFHAQQGDARVKLKDAMK